MRSNIGLFLGVSALSTAAVFALPAAGAAVGIAIAPWVLAACKTALGCAILLTAIAVRHRFRYDLSLIYTVCTQREWWHEISSDVVLGAIPLIHHVEQLKVQGITHVVTLLEEFELERGIAHPATAALWLKSGIKHFHIPVKDFQPVPTEAIQNVVAFMQEIRRVDRLPKFYIHCKAGRGRSATVVVADRVANLVKPVVNLEEQLKKQIGYVKAIRERINLNAEQQAAILAWSQLQKSWPQKNR